MARRREVQEYKSLMIEVKVQDERTKKKIIINK
jgi:hypothetical protein